MSGKNWKNFQTAKARLSFEEGNRVQRTHQAVEESLAVDRAVEEELEMEDFEEDCILLSALEDGDDSTPFIRDLTARDSVVCSSSDLRSAQEELNEWDEPGDPELRRRGNEATADVEYDPLNQIDPFDFLDFYDCEDGLIC